MRPRLFVAPDDSPQFPAGGNAARRKRWDFKRHGSPVDVEVWTLYANVIARLGPVATLLERDNDVPALATLLAEAGQAEALMAARAEPRRCGTYWGAA